MSKRLKVLLVFDSPYKVERGYDFKEEFRQLSWSTENDVYRALKHNFYDVRLLGLFDDIRPLIEEIKEYKPDVVFNLTEVFRQKSQLDKNVAWVLEMLGVPFTGASPASLLICNNKALSKKILSFHKIKVPNFQVFMRGKKVWLPRKLKLPLIIKPLCEEASRGISLSSVVDSPGSFIERIQFIHESMKTDAIAEEYIDGRELYVSILGSKRTEVLPFREMKFGQFPDDEPRIATYKAKWDFDYREKWGIKNVFAGKLAEGWEKKIKDTCRRAYKALNMECYARFDIRVSSTGEVYILEANANPSLDRYDELAQSAEKKGIDYNNLIRRIVDMAFKRQV